MWDNLKSMLIVTEEREKSKQGGRPWDSLITCGGSQQKKAEACKLSHMQRLWSEKLLNTVNVLGVSIGQKSSLIYSIQNARLNSTYGPLFIIHMVLTKSLMKQYRFENIPKIVMII
jgi:hypothetical protein